LLAEGNATLQRLRRATGAKKSRIKNTMLKVFIADNSKVVRERLKELLMEKGDINVVGTAGDARQAILDIRRLKPDVVILDIRMPGGGGMPVLKDIKVTSPDRVVIVFTSHPYPQYRQAYLTAGADYFFDKTREIQKMTGVLAGLARQPRSDPSGHDDQPAPGHGEKS